MKWKAKNSWKLLVVPKPLFIGRGQAIHKYGRRLWVVWEHPCLTEDSKVKVYLFALWIIEQAFLERGYVAYGGEYILIALVFFTAYKLMNIGKEERWTN